MGLPRAPTYPAQARFKFGNGRLGGVRFVADITVGVAGATRNFAAFVLDADIPAVLHRGASESLGGQLDFSRVTLTSGFRGAQIPPKVNDMGHCTLSFMDFGGRRGVRDGGPNFSASMAEWARARERPNPDNG